MINYKQNMKEQTVKDYKKIIKYNQHPDQKITTFKELVGRLIIRGIRPQEAYEIIFNSKKQYNARFYWTMTKIALYVIERIKEWDNKMSNTLTIPKMLPKGKKFKDLSYSTRMRILSKLFS